MRNKGFRDAYNQTKEYSKMKPRDRVQLRKRRLYDLVTYAKENSPLYAERLADLPRNFTINDIEPINKELLFSNYDNWSTDREVTLASLEEHLSGENADKLYLDRYYMSSTSGTEGERLVSLFDEECAKRMSATYLNRNFSKREHFRNFLLKGGKVANIYSGTNAFFYNTFATMREKYLPHRANRSLMLSAQSSTLSLVNELNAFKPAMLSGFPSVLSRMADEKKASRLKISPIYIVADGEPLDKETRTKLETIFGCDVTRSYSTALSGCIAYECREHHLHINDDWIIVEPVDEHNNSVKAGKTSDKLLITNLANFIQPVIRCELGDRIRYHERECMCGNKSPWLELRGRNLDQIRFVDGSREIIVPVSELDDVLRNEDYIKRYQIIVNPNNLLELRLSGAQGTDKTMAFFKAEKLLRSYMKSIGIIAPMITLDKEPPMPDPLSGKYQTVIMK